MTIHDALFKATFTQPEHAAGELRHVLPADFVKMLDFATLAVEPGSYIDEALKERQSDVLLSIRTGATRTLVYVLYEHQSTVDRLMAFRLLRYMVRIWERRLRKNSEAERLPPILPVVLHQSPTGWTAPVQLGELLDVEPAAWRSIKTYVPTFQFFLDDISTDTVDSIRGRAMTAFARLVLFCLRHSREPDNLLGRFDEFLDLRREVVGLGTAWQR